MIDYYETKSQPITKLMVWQAYKKVRQNKGSSGVDGMTWAKLDSDLPGHLYKLWNRMSSGSYLPQPVREVLIPKKGGGTRPYARKYDFLGFSIRPVRREVNGRWLLLPGTFVSQKSKKAIREKFRELEIHKRRVSIKELAQKLNPIIRGLINYYHKFWQAGMRDVWNGLNHRLLKWVKWEKGLYKYGSVKWLKQQYKESPGLFAHWKLL